MLKMSFPYLPSAGLDRNVIITQYFTFGFKYDEILAFLSLFHNYTLSLTHILKKLDLGQRGRSKDQIQTVINAVENELRGTGKDLEYRAMHAKITKFCSIVTDRETVRLVLRHLDPDGVLFRRQRRLRRRQYYTAEVPMTSGM
jgi:hypothetical protein